MNKTSELLVKTTLNSGILNYFLSQGDFIAVGRIRIRFFSEVGSGSGQNGPDPPTLATINTNQMSYSVLVPVVLVPVTTQIKGKEVK
jgi:hypothetical protein